MRNIAILLATYNGEEYLRQQLDSLYQQTVKDWSIYAHDDGSTDQTPAILRDYAEKYDNFNVLDYPIQHGAKNNFLSLLQAVEADYYLFCDQDDKWRADKIEIQMAKIKEIESSHPDKPVIVFSDLSVVDKDLNLTGQSLWEVECIYPEYLTTFDEGGALEFVTGCTMLFNKQAKDTVVFPADKAVMHDAWITLCVLRSGGILKAIYEPLVYYRQHGNNVLGVNNWSQYSRIRRLLNIWKSIVANYKHYRMLSALGYGSVFKYLHNKHVYGKRRKLLREANSLREVQSKSQHPSQIAILMATYNGGRFVAEQIDSLLAQTCQDWHLYVHDDGSQDDTVAIIRSYASTHPGKITILDYPPAGGPCKNFLSMLDQVEAPYYMFCDQDDVWLPRKIELSIKALKKTEESYPHKGIVVYTDLQIVDENLTLLFASMWEHSGIYPQYIRTFTDSGGHTAIATGCTMMFNDEAKKCCRFPTSKALMHDSWLCICVLKCGGVLKGIEEKTVLYRQHGSNTLGAMGTKAADIGMCYRMMNIRRVFRSNRLYYAMIASLGYGSVLKYLYSKVKYKMRIKRGYY